jgi:hypothetical protein
MSCVLERVRLHAIGERGGSISTPPYHWPAQLEVQPESELPDKLRSLGWTLISRAQITRIGQDITHDRRGGPKPGTSYGFNVRHVFEILPPQR